MASANYSVSLSIESKYFGVIVGAKGATLKQITTETKARIKLPPPNQTGDVVITGETQECLDAARQRIESIVESARQDMRITHLINIRVADKTIRKNYEHFMQEVLADGLVDGLTEAMFMRPEKLHITIDMMKLLDESDFARATEALNECVDKVIIPVKKKFGKIKMNILGVGISEHVNPRQARTVFGKIESAALQKIAEGVMDHFIARGVFKRGQAYAGAKIHTKLFSTHNAMRKYETEAMGDLRSTAKPCPYLDVRTILAKYANYRFGSQRVNEIAITSVEDEDSDGYYKTVASVKF